VFRRRSSSTGLFSRAETSGDVIDPVLAGRFQSVNANLSPLQESLIASRLKISPWIDAWMASKAAESNQAGVSDNQPSFFNAGRLLEYFAGDTAASTAF